MCLSVLWLLFLRSIPKHLPEFNCEGEIIFQKSIKILETFHKFKFSYEQSFPEKIIIILLLKLLLKKEKL